MNGARKRQTRAGTFIVTLILVFRLPVVSADHADHHVIVSPPNFDNTSIKTIFSGDDGGWYKAADWSTVGGGGSSDCSSCTSGWTSLNNNLGVTQFYGAGANPPTPRVLGGPQDNGTLVYNGRGTSLTSEFGGDGGCSTVDPTNANNLCGEYVSYAGPFADRLAQGRWGGEHVVLTVTEKGGHAEFDCASGDIAQPIEIGSDGAIDVRGVFAPDTPGPQKREPESRDKPARYTGHIAGRTLTLTVTLVDSNETIGTFSLTYDATPNLRRCR